MKHCARLFAHKHGYASRALCLGRVWRACRPGLRTAPPMHRGKPIQIAGSALLRWSSVPQGVSLITQVASIFRLHFLCHVCGVMKPGIGHKRFWRHDHWPAATLQSIIPTSHWLNMCNALAGAMWSGKAQDFKVKKQNLGLGVARGRQASEPQFEDGASRMAARPSINAGTHLFCRPSAL